MWRRGDSGGEVSAFHSINENKERDRKRVITEKLSIVTSHLYYRKQQGLRGGRGGKAHGKKPPSVGQRESPSPR